MPHKLALIVVMMWCSTILVAGANERLNMGGSTANSDYVPYYESLIKAINNTNPDLEVTLFHSGGFGKNILLMKEGRLDFGGVSEDLLQEEFDTGNNNLRVLWWVNPAVQNIMVRKDTGATTINDLIDLCFYPGMTGSATQNTMVAILLALNIRPGKLYISDPENAIKALRDGHCDGQVKTFTGNQIDTATMELNRVVPMRPIGYTQEEVSILKRVLPWLHIVDVAPGIVEGAPGYKAHAVGVGMAAPATLQNEVAYKIVKGMFAGIDSERTALDEGTDFDVLRYTLESKSYPLHAGAVRFYRELGVDVPARLLPPEM